MLGAGTDIEWRDIYVCECTCIKEGEREEVINHYAKLRTKVITWRIALFARISLSSFPFFAFLASHFLTLLCSAITHQLSDQWSHEYSAYLEVLSARDYKVLAKQP